MSDDAHAARALQALRDYRDARAAGNANNQVSALQEFDNNVAQVGDKNVRAKLRDVKLDLVTADFNRAFQEFGRVVNEKFAGLDAAFKVGAEMANKGEQSLFFPAAAVHLAQVAGIVQELKNAAENVAQSVHSIVGSFKKKDVDAIVDEAEKIKKTIDGLVSALGSVRNGLT